MTELRALVDLLTKPREVAVRDHGRHLGTRTDPPLLTQLRADIPATIGNGNGTKAAHERSTLNAGASELHTAIQKRIRKWAIAANVPRHWDLIGHATPLDWTDPAQLLRAWHARTLGDSHFNPDPYASTLAGWIAAINDILDPPRRYPLDAPCPICEHHWVTTLNDGEPERHLTLNVIDRPSPDENDSKITCRACPAIWEGIFGARDLRRAIDDAASDTARAAS